jgi:dUTPase
MCITTFSVLELLNGVIDEAYRNEAMVCMVYAGKQHGVDNHAAVLRS